MIKAVIFDCFGVLVGAGFWNVYRSLGGDPDKDAALIEQTLLKNDLGQLSQSDLYDLMAQHLGVTKEQYVAAYANDELPNRSVFDFINSGLKGKYKLAVLSNARPGAVQRKIPPELLGLFDAVVVSGEVGLVKPDPAVYRLTLERLGVAPEEAVFIDDHQEYLPAAEALGIHTILYKDLDDFRQQLANIINRESLPANG